MSNAENGLKEKFEVWQKSMGHFPVRVSAKDMDYQTSTIQAQWEGWKACTEALHEAYCDDLAYQRDRLEKGYYEQVGELKQKYEAIEKENAQLLGLIMEKNSLDPILMKTIYPLPMPIYPLQDERNLYTISYKYEEATGENSPWKPTVEQLQQLIYKYRSVKTHPDPDNEDSLELSVFLWALGQYEKGLL